MTMHIQQHAGRFRRFTKWKALSVTTGLFAAWIGSGWGWAGYDGPGYGAFYEYGDLVVVSWDPSLNNPNRPYWRAYRAPSFIFEDQGLQTLVLRTKRTAWYPPQEHIAIHGWLFVLIAAIPTGFAWRCDIITFIARRKPKQNACPHCRFDLAGLAPDVRCPECGNLRALLCVACCTPRIDHAQPFRIDITCLLLPLAYLRCFLNYQCAALNEHSA